jgi:hypothetical protein
MNVIYYQCESCFHIEPNTAWVIEGGIRVCSHCGASNRNKLWPSTEVRELLETVTRYKDVASFEYGLVASVFVSAALELLLERLLFTVAIEDLSYDEVGHLIDYLLDSNQGRARRIKLYSRLGYGTLQEESDEVGYDSFMKHWDEIADVRNKSVHGDLKASTELNAPLVELTINEALAVFSKLHNKYNSESLTYKVAIERKLEFQKEYANDLEKLRRWKRQVTGEIDLDEDI